MGEQANNPFGRREKLSADETGKQFARDIKPHVMDYPSITKERCIELTDGRVCPSCGCPLQPLDTVDNAGHPTFWAGCMPCQRFSWGVKPLIFQIAKEMVDDHHYIAYSYLGVKENHPQDEWPEWYRSQYSGTCSTVQQVLNILERINKA